MNIRDVSRQIRSPGECLVAQRMRTAVGPQTRVRVHVLLQNAIARERLRTTRMRASIRLLSRVRIEMKTKISVVSIRFFAVFVRTDEKLFSSRSFSCYHLINTNVCVMVRLCQCLIMRELSKSVHELIWEGF